MPAAGYTPILLYGSANAGATPAAANLTNGTGGSEIAINITDGRLYYKDNNGAVQLIGAKLNSVLAAALASAPDTPSGFVTQSGADARYAALNGSGTQAFSVANATTTTQAVNLGQVQALTFSNPMTAAGDIIIGGTSGAAESLAPGANGDVLTLVGGLPAWSAPGVGTEAWEDVLSYGTNAAAFTSAATAAGNGVVVLPNGNTITLGSAVTGGTTTFLTLGSTYTDPTNLPGATDTSVFGKSGAIWTKDFGIAGGGGTTTNEFVMALQGIAKTSTGSATGPYEKAILYVNGRQDDATNYASNYLFDLANVESIVTANNTNTRMWGYHALVQFPSGTGGFGLGFDSEMHNPSGELASGITDQQKGKWAYATEAAEGTITGGLVLIGGSPYTTGQFQYGIAMYPGAVISGNPSVVIPNACPISAWNSAGTGIINCLYVDASGDVVVGNNATSVSITPGLNALGGVGTTHLTLTGATPGGSGTTYTITLGGTVTYSASAGTNGAVPSQVQGYLEFAVNGAIYKIPYFNN